MTAGGLLSQRARFGFSGEILAYQMRTLSDKRRGMMEGGALTEKKIKIRGMEAGTDGCSRPSRGLHLQSSLSAGRIGIRRGSRSCREARPSSHTPGEKKEKDICRDRPRETNTRQDKELAYPDEI